MRIKIKIAGPDRNIQVNRLKALAGEFCALKVRSAEFGLKDKQATCLDISFVNQEDSELYQSVIQNNFLNKSGCMLL